MAERPKFFTSGNPWPAKKSLFVARALIKRSSSTVYLEQLQEISTRCRSSSRTLSRADCNRVQWSRFSEVRSKGEWTLTKMASPLPSRISTLFTMPVVRQCFAQPCQHALYNIRSDHLEQSEPKKVPTTGYKVTKLTQN